jgi:hypothetical protein
MNTVTPAEAGVYFKNKKLKQMDARLHGHDGVVNFFG